MIRLGIRRQLAERKRLIASDSLEKAYEARMGYIERLRSRPIAIETDAANKQHYEVGTGVLVESLGPRMKYSCCLYPTGRESLAQAEVAMLKSYIEKADLKDGMAILDLGLVPCCYLVLCFALTDIVVLQMRLGLVCALLCGGVPVVQDHGTVELEDAEGVH